MDEAPPTRYARMSDGVDIAYRVFEGGSIDLIYVQAYISAMEAFWAWPGDRRLLGGLAALARLVEFDGRGTGLSGRTGKPATLETRVRDLGGLMDAVGMERAALFAILDGAAVATMFAAQCPERVSSLALFHPTVRTMWAEDYPWGARPDEQAEFRSRIWALWNTPEPSREQMSLLSGDIGEAADDPAFARWHATAVRYLMTPSEFEAVDALWEDTDVRHLLPSIQAPTVVLHRREADEGDGLWQAIADAIPGGTSISLPGSEGLPMLGNVDALVDAVAAHLRVERPIRISDRVLTSILFTDIVDSTGWAAELGDAEWKALLARHDELARTMIERFDGRFIHTTGDGVLATFDGPARAVHCAREIAEAVRPLGVEIRSGIHTGEVELVADDVQGLGVHIGARVAAKAGPSEVMVSRTVKDLVAGSGLVFVDAGEHELKGVPGRWHLYRVVSS